MVHRLLEDVARVMRTSEPVIIFPASGTGGWEAAIANTMAPGDRFLIATSGHFANLWRDLATKLGIDVTEVAGDWREPIDVAALGQTLVADTGHTIRAVGIVHNETSTGVTSDIAAVRAAIDDAGHPALLLVDAVSSLGSMPYEHEAWGVDVTIAASQKGLMLPPGLAFNAISQRAIDRARSAGSPRGYWDWDAVMAANKAGSFPSTPATNLLFGLRAALDLLFDEGLPAVFARHQRHAAATIAAVEAWGLDVVARDPQHRSATVTGVLVPESIDADELRAVVLERCNVALGTGLSKLASRAFRIGHLGDFNDAMLLGTLASVEVGLQVVGAAATPKSSGVAAAVQHLAA